MYDVVVVGGGVVGATTALALAKNTQLRIAILDANAIQFTWEEDNHDHRVSAISLASKKIFQNLNVWSAVADKRITPYTNMRVWHENSSSEIHFDCKEVNEFALGYIIKDNAVRVSLMAELKRYSHVDFIFPQKLMGLQNNADGLELQLEHSVIKTRLLIAADGANSRVRELIKSKTKERDYGHTAIVATVKTELSNEATAWQRFLSKGPLAFLPLNEKHESSIVWSTTHDHAKKLLTLDDEQFCAQITEAFDKRLGRIIQTRARYHFPLRMRHINNYVQPRIALVGDAAHTIHPLMGQGVNLGLLDAVCLAEVIIEATEKNRDFSSFATLRRYERWRKSDNLAMLASVDALKQIFATENPTLQQIRNAGIAFVNRTALIKNFFINYALGKRGDLPMLTR